MGGKQSSLPYAILRPCTLEQFPTDSPIVGSSSVGQPWAMSTKRE